MFIRNHKVHYEKVKTLYLYEGLEKIKVDRKFTNDCVAIELNCFEEKSGHIWVFTT